MRFSRSALINGWPTGPAISARVKQAVREWVGGAVALCLSLGLAACSLVEGTLPERGYALNVGSGNLREDVILLNLVRASQFEPMNFVALSKWNGSGIVEANVQGTRNDGLLYDVLNKGPLAAGTTATSAVLKQSVTPSLKLNTAANFDLAPLDNKEFYAGFLAQLELPTINLLVNAGLSRELVLNSIVDAARVTVSDGTTYVFYNHPYDDTWAGDRSPKGAAHCEALALQGAFRPLMSTNYWRGSHSNDCNYQKFLHFLHAAVEYGMTTESREFPNPLAGKDKTQAPFVTKVVLCYDPAVAHQYGRTVTSLAKCGTGRKGQPQPRYGDIAPEITKIEPILRSSYGVYQYYGRMLATNTANRVRLIDAGTPRLPTGDRKILTVKKDSGDCFARAVHPSGNYCVPNSGANNTKEIFFLLNALVYLSTTRSALPTTPTVQLAP